MPSSGRESTKKKRKKIQSVQRQMRPCLEQLNDQELKKLQQLKQEVQQIKKAKAKSNLSEGNKTKSSSKKSPTLKQLQADRYIRLSFYLLRQGIFTNYVNNKDPKKEDDKNDSKTYRPYNQLYLNLKFYKDTYNMNDQKNPQKLHIFEAINQSELKKYINKLAIIKIQVIAQSIHTQLQLYFHDHPDFFKIECMQASQIEENRYILPLKNILIQIERSYLWDRWQSQYSSTLDQKKSLSKHGLFQYNAQTLQCFQQIIKQISEMNTNKIIQDKITYLIQYFKNLKNKKQTNKQNSQQKSKQGNKQENKQNTKQILKQVKKESKQQSSKQYDQLQKREQVEMRETIQSNIPQKHEQKIQTQEQYQHQQAEEKKQQQNAQKSISEQRSSAYIMNSKLLSLRTFSLQIQRTQKSDLSQSIRQAINRQKLRQRLNEFNYGIVSTYKEMLTNSWLMEQRRSREISEFIEKKEINKRYLNDFRKIYEKYNNTKSK